MLKTAFDAIDQFTEGQEGQEILRAKARALMAGYHYRWRHEDIVPEQIERVIETSLVNPDTGRSSRTFHLAGKIDVIARTPTQRLVIDHKTTSHNFSDVSSPYWQQLQIEGQASHYQLMMHQIGERVDNVMWDVIRRPETRPKKITKAQVKEWKDTSRYLNVPVTKDEFSPDVETLRMYEIRLFLDIQKRPDHYLARRYLPRLDHELLEYARELWRHGQDLVQSRKHEWHPRNSGACLTYGQPCKFLGICSGHDEPDSDRWVTKSTVHAELPGIEDHDGIGYLTNSRIRTWQTCRRKHFYDYEPEHAIERDREEVSEPLYFGNLMHAGLNAWWKSRMEGSENDQ